MSDDPVLSVHDVAERLRRNYRTVLRYIRDGDLRGVKRCGRWYVLQSALDDFLAEDRSSVA